MAHAQKQLDVLVSDAAQRLDVIVDPTNQVIVTGTSRMHLHTTMPVTTARGEDKSTHTHTMVTSSRSSDYNKYCHRNVPYTVMSCKDIKRIPTIELLRTQ